MKLGPFRIFEQNIPTVRVKGKVPSFTGIGDNAQFWELLGLIKKIKTDRLNKKKTYETMAHDSVVNAAMEMIAEDATQIDPVQKHIFWVESSSSDLNNILNQFLWEDFNVDSRIFSIAFAVCIYGEFYLKTYYSDKLISTTKKPALETKMVNESLTPIEQDEYDLADAEEFYEDVVDSTNILHLERFGKLIGYMHSHNNESGATMYPPQDFIHFISDRGNLQEDLSVKYKDPKTGKQIEKNFKVRYGSSFLSGSEQAFNIVSTLEDVMVLSRIARSSLFRIFQVNVGTASKLETLKILREVKNSINTKERFDPQGQQYKSDNNPIPMADKIFVPTRGGKGEINVETVGGDVDVRSIVDFDYFWNKFCGSLKVPKAFLGFEDDLPGGLGDTSLTRLDVRYARSVKRLVTVLKIGLKDLCNHHLLIVNKPQFIDKFEIGTTHINDSEESDRVKDIAVKSETATDLLNVLNAIPGGLDGVDTKKFTEYIFKMIGVKYDDFKLSDSEYKKVMKQREISLQQQYQEQGGENGQQ